MKKLFGFIAIFILLAGCAKGGPAPATEPQEVSTNTPVSLPATQTIAIPPTALAIDPDLYQGWSTYANSAYGFSVRLPEDWTAEEDVSDASPLYGHLVNLHPVTGNEAIRMTFRRQGEDTLLWPSGVGQGEFLPQGSLTIAGEPALRVLLVCPTGEVTSIWYHQAEDQANIVRSGLEFGFIFSAGAHCEAGKTLSGKIQQVGEMIIASLKLL